MVTTPPLSTPNVPQIVQQIAAAIQPAPLRFVGGFVRCYLTGMPTDNADLDLCTPALPATVEAACQQAGLTVDTKGKAFGVLKIQDGENSAEMATLRRDIQPDGRHTQVEFITDWQTDSWRRDFTFNAIYLGLDGTVLDFHDGQADLAAKHVRFIGQPQQRVREDQLRFWRYLRFCGLYGIPPEMTEIIQQCLPLVNMEAAKQRRRARTEIQRLINTPHAEDIQQLLRQHNLDLNQLLAHDKT